jgi:DNA-binding response OmpR family regulator
MTAKILLVDDSPGVQETLGDLLRAEGFQIGSAYSGEEALEILSGAAYDLVLLDLRLPGLDGVSVMHEINKYHPETRIIILTGHGSLDTAIEAIRSGAQDYILKPYNINDILTSIAGVLSDKENQTRKGILIDQLSSSLDQLRDVEGIRGDELPARRVLSLPGGVLVDLERREIWRGNDRSQLTPTESKLLATFLENKSRVLSHSELVFLVQGIRVEEEDAPEILRPMISRLRKKLAIFPATESWISNVRGTGYLFDPS